MRVHVIGGFLGAGKTTAIGALARYYAERGERVAIVTNDQGHALVDTAALVDVLASKSGSGSQERRTTGVTEIGGGCFCCRFPELEDGLVAAAGQGATVALAEAVGSCTDLVATVLSPLA
ncbi:MAG: G3E family GTPase, partial [Myxococcota bacterium]